MADSVQFVLDRMTGTLRNAEHHGVFSHVVKLIRFIPTF